MAFTHTLSFGWSNGGNFLSKSASLSAGEELNIEDTIANGQTDKVVACAIDISQLKAIFICSDKAITLKTNTGSDDTFSLAANTPIVWYLGSGLPLASIFSADITQLEVTNASGATATLIVRALIDPTL